MRIILTIPILALTGCSFAEWVASNPETVETVTDTAGTVYPPAKWILGGLATVVGGFGAMSIAKKGKK